MLGVHLPAILSHASCHEFHLPKKEAISKAMPWGIYLRMAYPRKAQGGGWSLMTLIGARAAPLDLPAEPLCLCSPILIFWWNYSCPNVCAVSEVAGVWCLGPEGWRRDHQRLPPIHLECSRGVKIWSLGGSANRCHVLQNSHSHHILFMTHYMLQVACISVHICKSFSNRGKNLHIWKICLFTACHICCWFVACFRLSSFYRDDD